MAAGLEQELQTITELAARAAGEISSLRAHLAASEEREALLRRDLAEREDQLAQARSDIKFLQFSHRLASSPDSLVEARRMISGLIRNIDKAISDLKE